MGFGVVGVSGSATEALGGSASLRVASATEFAAEVRRAAAPRGMATRWWPVVVALLGMIAAAGLLAIRSIQPKVPAGIAAPSPQETLAEATNLFFQKKHAEAEALYTAYLEQFPDDVEAITRRGLCRTGRRAFAAGAEDFTRALERKPQDANLHKQRAMAYASLRQFEPVIVDYEAAIALDPADRETRESFGACYSIMAAEKADRKEFAAAADLMSKAIEAYPHAPVFYHQRGSCLFHMGEFEKALANLDQAILMEPRKPEHYENRGHCYRALGRAEEAEREFKKAEELRTP